MIIVSYKLWEFWMGGNSFMIFIFGYIFILKGLIAKDNIIFGYTCILNGGIAKDK